ncbi:hypothetical protein M0805_006396 [Coniferiporia weirii]|nr:hypothetical protein M0805_006396 [Coniferiporia weirii]
MPVQLQLQHYASSVTSHRVLLYGVFSVGVVLAVVANALKKHSNFYSVAVYLSKSNGTVVVLANFGVLLAILFGRLLQQVFFGPLRAMEVERLYDRMWFFVTESLLAFTIFRDEFDIPFALMFGLLLFTKCFHWLLSDRIEWMDQRPYPGPPLLFHIRVHVLITLLWATDLIAFLFTIENMLSHGVGGTVLFASEYAILLASLMNSVAKYSIALIDLRRASSRGGENAPPWENKSMLVFYVELATDFLKLVTYLTFFMLVLTFYGLPLNIVRDVYITARSFIMRFRDLIRYRTATRNMDERYPNATEAELSTMSDRTCIICRDEMVPQTAAHVTQEARDPTQAPAPVAPQDGPNTTPKKLPCGHIFHFYCLRSWLERQQSCPTCRQSVLEVNQAEHANGQAAPRPQAGAFPQMPAGNGPAQQLQWQLQQLQQQQQQQQQGIRGGIFGRLMGAAGVPPMVPGQFAPGVLPGQAAPVANGMGWEGQQPQGHRGQPPMYAPPFAYPQYPFPRPQPFALQPERFQGFWAPDGNWHPWPNAPENAIDNNLEAQAPALTPTAADLSTARTNADQHSDADSSGTGNGARLTATPGSSSLSPPGAREAAAAAALRRLNPDNQAPVANQAPVQNQTTSAREGSTGEAPGRAPAPALIPLFDPRNASPPVSRGFRGMQSTRASVYAGVAGRPPSTVRQGLHGVTGTRDLPSTLSDEQLVVLDQLTREAIDERLRILENIQITTARCAMELLRTESQNPPPEASSKSDESTSVPSATETRAEAGEPQSNGSEITA